MLPGTTTRTWTEYQARADLNNNIDLEVFPDRLKELIDPHPHLSLVTWSAGVDEGIFYDDYYIVIKFKSDLPQADASDEMKAAIDVASPGIVTSWFLLKVSQAETSVDVVTSIAEDTKEVATKVGEGAKTAANIAVGVAESTPSLVSNFHWIALSAAAIALVAGAFYFAPIIFARK
jgi:hypothetical protein